MRPVISLARLALLLAVGRISRLRVGHDQQSPCRSHALSRQGSHDLGSSLRQLFSGLPRRVQDPRRLGRAVGRLGEGRAANRCRSPGHRPGARGLQHRLAGHAIARRAGLWTRARRVLSHGTVGLRAWGLGLGAWLFCRINRSIGKLTAWGLGRQARAWLPGRYARRSCAEIARPDSFADSPTPRVRGPRASERVWARP